VKLLASAVLAVAVAAPAVQLPRAAHGQKVAVLARHVPLPTAFAFGDGQVFVGGYGDANNPTPPGGVYVVAGGKARVLAAAPAHVSGLAFANGTLYVSGDDELVALSHWNGRTFTKSRVITAGPAGFRGFSGIAVGRNGRVYAGVANRLDGTDDYAAGTTPYANDVVSVDPSTGRIGVVSTGIRQPWQLLFAPGHAGPLATDLGQDNLGAKRPPDFVVEATPGADFGFPSCPAQPATCAAYAKPFLQLAPHASPMGLAYSNGKLYIALYTGLGKGPEVVSLPVRGGRIVPFLTRFPSPIIALGAHAGRLYVGAQDGTIYSVKP
jgi:outer membrane protein assembly factor BamB